MVADGAAVSPPDLPPRRVILLGASNLTRGIATVIDACHRRWGEPLDCLAALGHGRSYGARSTVLGRTLPSIQSCRLWTALEERPTVPTAALVTDIGNDVMYEAPVEKIVEWVTRCFDQLDRYGARIVMTRLPVANIDRVPEWKFRVLRRLMFPRGRIPYAAIAARARELDERLSEVATRRGIAQVRQDPAWYGWDPIHFRSSAWPEVWHRVLSGWGHDSHQNGPNEPAATNPPLSRLLYLRTRTPDERWLLGFEQRGQQPCARLSEGTIVSYY
jgi:hypothetical protein